MQGPRGIALAGFLGAEGQQQPKRAPMDGGDHVSIKPHNTMQSTHLKCFCASLVVVGGSSLGHC